MQRQTPFPADVREKKIGESRELLPPGSLLYFGITHSTKTTRLVRVYRIVPTKDGSGVDVRDLTQLLAEASGLGYDVQRGALRRSYPGPTQLGFGLAWALGHSLYPSGFGCCGVRCRSNDHANGDENFMPHTCVAHLPTSGNDYWSSHQHRSPIDYSTHPYRACAPPMGKYGVCHWHNDGGYAFDYRWL